MFTLQVGMALFRGQYHTEWNLLMAVVVIGMVPTLVFAIFCQRYLVKGMVLSGVKG
jgi:multiple sugar transport system permease protein